MRLTHITIACHAVDHQIAWFTQHGWATAPADASSIVIGDSMLCMQDTQTPHAYHYAMAVPKNSVAAAAQWCIAQGIPLIASDSDNPIYQFEEWGMQAIYFFDGAGNVAEFIGAYDATQPLYKTFEVSMVQGICEIGVVTAQVAQYAQALKHTYGLESFYSYNDTFHPVGDAQGRMIVVEPNREWYPSTGVSSTIAPVSVQFEVHGQSHHITMP